MNEAYELMDQGKNAKAILLLEPVVEKNPKNTEARIMLASAYLGNAGVHVYSAHDSFHDILFTRPLGESFWGAYKPKIKMGPDCLFLPGSASVNVSEEEDEPSIVEKVLEHAGCFLGKLQAVTAFLTRFPDVPSEKWGYLDRALDLLVSIDNMRDVALYRIFIRVIYIKAVLKTDFVQNLDFGNKDWACSLQLEQLKDNVHWVAKQLDLTKKDFEDVYPDKTSVLEDLKKGLHAFLDSIDEFRSTVPGRFNSAFEQFHGFVLEKFHCLN